MASKRAARSPELSSARMCRGEAIGSLRAGRRPILPPAIKNLTEKHLDFILLDRKIPGK
jgi:hypothetical protein